MKRLVTAFLALVIALAAFPSLAQTIKLGTLAPEGSVWYRVLREMGEDWKRLSGRQIQLRIYPGGIAGDDSDMVRKMRIGQLHAAALTSQGLATIDEDIGVFQMPMLLTSDGELEFVQGELSGRLANRLEEKGFKVLYWSQVGWVYLFSNRPVTAPGDLKPLDVWVWSGDAAWADALKDAGYKPVPLPATEIHTALTSGLVDAFATTPVAALSYQWFGQARNMMNMKWGPLTAAVVISTRTWERIPDDLKPKLQAAAVKAGDAAKDEILKLEADAIEAMQGYGLAVNAVSGAEEEMWKAEIRKTYPKLLGKSIPEPIYRDVVAILEDYRAGGDE